MNESNLFAPVSETLVPPSAKTVLVESRAGWHLWFVLLSLERSYVSAWRGSSVKENMPHKTGLPWGNCSSKQKRRHHSVVKVRPPNVNYETGAYFVVRLTMTKGVNILFQSRSVENADIWLSLLTQSSMALLRYVAAVCWTYDFNTGTITSTKCWRWRIITSSELIYGLEWSTSSTAARHGVSIKVPKIRHRKQSIRIILIIVGI